MKKIFLFFTVLAWGAFAGAQEEDPVLMRIDGKDITRSEFEYIYNKNNANSGVDKKSLDEYVGLFVNFKLKVAEAEEAGLDTTMAFRKEFNGYRRQLAQAYLTDASVDEANALSAYNRLKENVEAYHLLIRVQPNASESEIADAYDRAELARQRALAGEDFETLAREVSEDPSVSNNGGYLGYFTAMQMIRPFEDAAYALQPGEVSEPVRTDFGFHVIKVTGRRPDIGRVLAAHIFKRVPQDATPEQEQQAKAKIDSIYNVLKAGGDFAEMAKAESDDKATGIRGGALPWFGVHQTMKEFEDVAFSLGKDEISKPFRTAAGYHIVKVSDRAQLEPFEEKKEEIMRRLTRMGEGNKGVEALVARLKQEYGFRLDTAGMASAKTTLECLGEIAGDSTVSVKPQAVGNLFVLAGKEYPAQGFVDWAENKSGQIDRLLEQYVSNQVLMYEDSRLEEKYPDFGHLMQEYRDGILLFEISNQKVWDKASKDEDGLARYYEDNKRDYAWNTPKFKGIVLHCVDSKTLKNAKKALKKQKWPEEEWSGKLHETFNNDSVSVVQASKLRLFVEGDDPYVDKLVFKEGSFEPMEGFPVTGVYGKLLKKGPESYKDVRGPVTADYQNYLEEEWVKTLRSKYKVEIDEEVLKTVNNH